MAGDENKGMDLMNEGLAYLDNRQWEEAINSFTRYIAVGKEDIDIAYYNRGEAYMELESYEQAIADFDNAIRLEPGCVLAHYNRGMAELELQRFAEAVEDFSVVIGNLDNPMYDFLAGSTYRYRAIAYEKLGDKIKANNDSSMAAMFT